MSRDKYEHYRPTHRVNGLEDVDVAALKALGIRAVLLDMDNTLSTWHGIKLAPGAQALVERLHTAGIITAVFSNNQPGNVNALAQRLGIDKSIARAGKPKVKAFIRAAAAMGVEPAACCVVGDQIMTDIAGARRAGFAAAILVTPLSSHEWIFTKFNRLREALILSRSGQAPNKRAD